MAILLYRADTKYPKIFRASLCSAQFFLSSPPPNLKSWNRPWTIYVFAEKQTRNAHQRLIGSVIVSVLASSAVDRVFESRSRGGSRISILVRRAHLNNLRWAEGGANIFGVFRVKNHDFTPKKIIFFSNFRGGHAAWPPPPLDPPLRSDQTMFCTHILPPSTFCWKFMI